jgi:hypothetical protein
VRVPGPAGARELAAPLIASVAGSTLLWAATTTSPFAFIDSAAYVEAARNLAASGSLIGTLAPATHFPPGYAALLSLGELHGRHDLSFARLLHVVLFASTLFLTTSLVSRSLGRFSTSLLTGVWAATSVTLLFLFGAVLSEAPYVLFLMAWVCLFTRYLEAPRTRMLGGAAVAAALAGLTRYIGIAIILAAVPPLALAPRLSRKRRLISVVVHSVIAGLPPSLWLLRNRLVAGDVLSRPFEVHPPGWSSLHDAADAVSGWLLPHRLPLWTRAFALAIVLASMVWAELRRRRGAAPSPSEGLRSPALLVCGSYVAAHLLVLLGSMTFADADLGRGVGSMGRLLAPVYLPMLAGTVILGARSVGRGRLSRGVAIAGAAGLTLVCTLHVWQGVDNVFRLAQDGLGFTSPRWRRSRVVDFVRRLPAGAVIYSNGPSALYLLTGRTVRELPKKYDLASARPSPAYAARLEAVKQSLVDERGVVVLWQELAFPYYPSLGELEALLPLFPAVSDQLGTAYRARAVGGVEPD